MAGQTVAGVGYHDLYFRWDISTPQPCIGRLLELPVHGSINQPGRTLFASHDRFGKWEHALGPRHVMLAYVVQVRDQQIRRLEVQAHLGPEGEDDLCPVEELPERYRDLTTRLALWGALPSEDPRSCGSMWQLMWSMRIREMEPWHSERSDSQGGPAAGTQSGRGRLRTQRSRSRRAGGLWPGLTGGTRSCGTGSLATGRSGSSGSSASTGRRDYRSKHSSAKRSRRSTGNRGSARVRRGAALRVFLMRCSRSVWSNESWRARSRPRSTSSWRDFSLRNDSGWSTPRIHVRRQGVAGPLRGQSAFPSRTRKAKGLSYR